VLSVLAAKNQHIHNTHSRIYTASCFDNKDQSSTKDSTAGENMMKQRPLITMRNEEPLEGEGQTTKLQKQRQRSLTRGIFLFGLHAGASSFMTIVNLDIGVELPWWMQLFFMYYFIAYLWLIMHKKWSEDAANPNPGSIWTRRMVFSMFGIYFLFGVYAGSFLILVWSLREGLPLMPLIFLFMMTELLVTLFFFLAIRFESRRHPIEQELEQDEDHSGVV
jgi:hypothetical protein